VLGNDDDAHVIDLLATFWCCDSPAIPRLKVAIQKEIGFGGRHHFQKESLAVG